MKTSYDHIEDFVNGIARPLGRTVRGKFTVNGKEVTIDVEGLRLRNLVVGTSEPFGSYDYSTYTAMLFDIEEFIRDCP